MPDGCTALNWRRSVNSSSAGGRGLSIAGIYAGGSAKHLFTNVKRVHGRQSIAAAALILNCLCVVDSRSISFHSRLAVTVGARHVRLVGKVLRQREATRRQEPRQVAGSRWPFVRRSGNTYSGQRRRRRVLYVGLLSVGSRYYAAIPKTWRRGSLTTDCQNSPIFILSDIIKPYTRHWISFTAYKQSVVPLTPVAMRGAHANAIYRVRRKQNAQDKETESVL